MHSGQGADDLQMTQFLGADVHEQVFTLKIITVKALNGILHGCGKFTVGATELLQQHVAKARIGCAYVNGVHQFLNMVIHQTSY